MQTTALEFPVTAPWQKPTSVIRVVRRPRSEPKRTPGPAINKPQSKWTVLVAFVLAVVFHIAPVVIEQMSLDAQPVEFAKALTDNTVHKTVD
jgi:hypothetical protein